jgi:hypothetical protein
MCNDHVADFTSAIGLTLVSPIKICASLWRNTSGADSDLDGIHSRFDQFARCFKGCDVSGDNLCIRVAAFDFFDGF